MFGKFLKESSFKVTRTELKYFHMKSYNRTSPVTWKHYLQPPPDKDAMMTSTLKAK